MFDKILTITIDNKNNTKRGGQGKGKEMSLAKLRLETKKNQTGIQRLDGGETAAVPHFLVFNNKLVELFILFLCLFIVRIDEQQSVRVAQ